MIRPLSPLNENYQPGRSWLCATFAPHECLGTVVGAVGAYPVCANGAVAEEAAREADQARRDAWLNSPEGQRVLRQEAAMERWIEGRG